jgi:ubiquinone/menaquinone biosynthesis C-methylase UbiE
MMKENHNPLGKTDYLSIQHTERYRFAASKLKPGIKVLDIASGTGYGTAMLSKSGYNVVGAEYDGDALVKAHELWGCEFVRADALELPFNDASFDSVVSFETIEHVKNGKQFVSEIHRVLRTGGNFLCSTPNKSYSSHPKYHVKEYGNEEFFELIEQFFPKLDRYGQYFKMNDRIKDLCKWNLETAIFKILGKTGTKEMLKGILLKFFAKTKDLGKRGNLRDVLEIDKILQRKESAIYKVIPCNETKLLRIMISMAVKET